MISTNFAVSAAAVSASTAASIPTTVTSSEVVTVKNSLGCNSTEKIKMTNFSIAAIMNNERGSGLVRPTPVSDNTKLGKKINIL